MYVMNLINVAGFEYETHYFLSRKAQLIRGKGAQNTTCLAICATCKSQQLLRCAIRAFVET